MIGSGYPEECPFCKAGGDFSEKLARTVTDEEFGKPMPDLPTPKPMFFDIILEEVSQDAKIRAVAILKKLMRTNSEKAFRLVQNPPAKILECIDVATCNEIKKELDGIARLSFKPAWY
jgi:ribosomal protein L7/L12